jgi:hypothetical protein
LKEPIVFSGFDMSGLTYRCLPNSSCSSYELSWVGEGTEPFCGGGDLGTEYGIIGKVCVLTF